MIKAALPVRQSDKYGDGKYLASRGDRKHNGVDFACYPGTSILSNCNGLVTKIGYPYASDPSYKYVEIKDASGYSLRYFYLNPFVNKDDEVKEGQVIGTVQSLQNRYPGITGHCHLEIKDEQGKFIDPGAYD